jgi:hypothetical protein
LVRRGNDALRIVAIAIMQARVDCRYFPVVLKAVEGPHSLMEQYQALKLGEEMVDDLDRLERRLFRAAILRARRRRRFRRDQPLMRLSERILRRLSDSSR